MPAHMKWKLNSRKKTKVFNSKPKTARLLPWDDSITDLSIYSSTPEEMKQRHLSHRSNNLEIAKMELLKNAYQRHYNYLEENKENMKQCNRKKCTAASAVTLGPKPEEKECMVRNIINEDCKNLTPSSSSKLLTDGHIDICHMTNSKEDSHSSTLSTTEVEQMLLCFQKNLHIGEDTQEGTSTLFPKGNISGITPLILATLEKLNCKCIKAHEDLILEKKKTKTLKKEVESLKNEVSTIKQDLVQLQRVLAELNNKLEAYNPESSNSQSHKLLKKPFEDQEVSFISSIDEQNLSNRAQYNSFLQGLSIQDSFSRNNAESNSSHCSNASEISCCSNSWQSYGAIMLSLPLQLNVTHQHSET